MRYFRPARSLPRPRKICLNGLTNDLVTPARSCVKRERGHSSALYSCVSGSNSEVSRMTARTAAHRRQMPLRSSAPNRDDCRHYVNGATFAPPVPVDADRKTAGAAMDPFIDYSRAAVDASRAVDAEGRLLQLAGGAPCPAEDFSPIWNCDPQTIQAYLNFAILSLRTTGSGCASNNEMARLKKCAETKFRVALCVR